MNPVLVTPPDGPVVDLPLLKQHLRIDGSDEDLLLVQQELAAVVWLDGWTGILGRAILPQTWAEEFDGWGAYRLAMPDVIAVDVTYRAANGDMLAAPEVMVTRDGSAVSVDVGGPATDLVRVEYQCGMNTRQLAAVQSIVLMTVGNWYRQRESVVIGTIAAELPMAVRSLVSALQWRKV